jgi:hypothetical protein
MTVKSGLWRHVVALFIGLTAIAAAAPEPWHGTDREQYQQIGRAVFLQGCAALHCSRILVPAVLEQLPGASVPKWKAYAVLANTWAAANVALLALSLGLSGGAATLAFWFSGLGVGGLFTLFDPYSADPLMFALGPLFTMWLVRGRVRAAGVGAAIGILAKEFAAAPLWIVAGASALAGRWWQSARVASVATAVTALWVLLQVALIAGYDFSYGGNPSADVLHGGYLVTWLRELEPHAALLAIFNEYGALYLLVPLGYIAAPPQLKRLAIAALPAVAAFVYVQQPERALWNFHFLITPLAAIVIARAPAALAALLLVSYALASMRVAAQLPFLPPARYGLAVSLAAGMAIAVIAWKGRRSHSVQESEGSERVEDNRFPAAYRVLLGASAAAVVVAIVMLVDVSISEAVERDRGLNRHGYRGPIVDAKKAGELRLAVVGGMTAFSPHLPQDQSLGGALDRLVRQEWRWQPPLYASAADLSQPNETAATVEQTLRDYAYLSPDIVVLLTGHNDLPGAVVPPGGRRESWLFRTFGYLPSLPAHLTGASVLPPLPEFPVDRPWIETSVGQKLQPVAGPCAPPFRQYCDATLRTIEGSLAAGRRVLVVGEPFVSAAHFAQQQALSGALLARYSDDPRVEYLDLGWRADPLNPNWVVDRWMLSAKGVEEFVDELYLGIQAMVRGS